MKKFNWDKFKSGELSVILRTKELAEDFYEECKKHGANWGFCDYGIWLENWKDGIAYEFDVSTNSLVWGHVERITNESVEWEGENKMEKTFREVIADIKEGEVWESENNSCDIRIEKGQTGISIRDFKGNALVWFSDRFKFKLQRKEYTFQEAFAAYEEGKEIESILTGDKFLKSKRADGSDFDSFWDKGIKSWWRFLYFELELIRGKWYIND